MNQIRFRTAGVLAVTALILTGISVVAPVAFAGPTDPTAAAIVVKGAAQSSVHVNLSPYITGTDVHVVDVTPTGGALTSGVRDLTIDPDGKGLTVTLPDWSSDAERRTGLSLSYSYVVHDDEVKVATGTMRIEIPRETHCDDSLSEVPQAVARLAAGVPVILDFGSMCEFDTAQYGTELAVGLNARVDVQAVTAAGASLTAVPGTDTFRWGYLPPAGADSGADWVDFTLTDALGKITTDRVMVMVDGATPVLDVFGQGAATATPGSTAGAVTVDAMAGLDWARPATPGAVPLASVLVTTPPINGTATAQSDGTVLYAARDGWHGADSFNYAVSATGGGVMVRAGTVTVEIAERPSANTQVAIQARSGAPVAADILSGAVGRGIKIASVTAPAHGRVEVLDSGQLQYTSSPEYIGNDGVVATLEDQLGQQVAVTVDVAVSSAIGAVGLTVQGLRNQPVVTAKSAVALGDFDTVLARNAVNGTVRGSGSALVFVPATDFVGTASYEVVVSDRYGAQATSTVTIQVLSKLIGLDVWVTAGQSEAVNLSV